MLCLAYLFLDPTCWPSLPGTSRRLRTSSMSCGAKFTEALQGPHWWWEKPWGNHRNMTHIWDSYGIPMGFLKDFYDLPIWDFYEYRIFFSTWDSWLPCLGWIWVWFNLKHVCVHRQWWQPIDWPGEKHAPERHSWFPALCSMNQLNSTIEMVQLKSAILTPPPIRQDDYDYPD